MSVYHFPMFSLMGSKMILKTTLKVPAHNSFYKSHLSQVLSVLIFTDSCAPWTCGLNAFKNRSTTFGRTRLWLFLFHFFSHSTPPPSISSSLSFYLSIFLPLVAIFLDHFCVSISILSAPDIIPTSFWNSKELLNVMKT